MKYTVRIKKKHVQALCEACGIEDPAEIFRFAMEIGIRQLLIAAGKN